MDAHKLAGEFLLQRNQRLLDEVLAAARAYGDVFLLGAQEHDVAHRHQQDAVALDDRQVFPRRDGGARQLLAPRGGGSRSFFQRGRESLGAHRLEQIVERVQLEGLDGMPVVRGDEDDARRLLERSEVARHLEPAHAGHLDVEQQDLRAARRNALHRLEAVACLADDVGRQLARDVVEQLLQPFARRRFVVGDEDAQRAHRKNEALATRYGISISTR